MANVAHPNHHHHDDNNISPTLRELQGIRQEIAALRRLLDSFARTYLRSRFPYGQPDDEFRDRGRRYG